MNHKTRRMEGECLFRPKKPEIFICGESLRNKITFFFTGWRPLANIQRQNPRQINILIHQELAFCRGTFLNLARLLGAFLTINIILSSSSLSGSLSVNQYKHPKIRLPQEKAFCLNTQKKKKGKISVCSWKGNGGESSFNLKRDLSPKLIWTELQKNIAFHVCSLSVTKLCITGEPHFAAVQIYGKDDGEENVMTLLPSFLSRFPPFYSTVNTTIEGWRSTGRRENVSVCTIVCQGIQKHHSIWAHCALNTMQKSGSW